jgi:hypothetical protein
VADQDVNKWRILLHLIPVFSWGLIVEVSSRVFDVRHESFFANVYKSLVDFDIDLPFVILMMAFLGVGALIHYAFFTFVIDRKRHIEQLERENREEVIAEISRAAEEILRKGEDLKEK